MHSFTSTSAKKITEKEFKSKIKELEKKLADSNGLESAEILLEIGESYDSLAKAKIINPLEPAEKAAEAFSKAANIYHNSQSYNKQIRLLTKAKACLRLVHDSGHPKVMKVSDELDSARTHFTNSSKGVKRSASNVHPVNKNLSDSSTAKKSCSVTPVARKSYHGTSASSSVVKGSVSVAFAAKGSSKELEKKELEEEVKKLRKQQDFSQQLELAQTLKKLGDVYFCLASKGNDVNENFLLAAKALCESGNIYHDWCDYRKAQELFEKAKLIYTDKLSLHGHPQLTEIRNNISDIQEVTDAIGERSASSASAARKSVSVASAESSGASVGRKSFSGASYDRIITTVAMSNPSSDVRKVIEDADFVPSKNCKEELLNIAIAPTGRPSLVTLSVEQGADPHSPNRDGYSPLQRAVISGNADSAKVLIEEQDVDLYFCNRNNHTAMYYAAVGGCWEIMYLFIKKGIDPNYSEGGSELIHYAAIGGNMDVITILVEGGAHYNFPNRDGDTPTWLAAVNDHQEAVEMFIKLGADFRSPNRDGDTLMHYAARNGWYCIVKLLIEQNADFRSPNRDGDTPIWLATRGDYYGIVELLIEQGVKHNSPNRDGDTLIDYARRNDCTNVLELLEGIESYSPSSNLNSVQPIGKDAVFRIYAKKLVQLDQKLQSAIGDKGEDKIVEAAIVDYGVVTPTQVIDAIIEEIKVNKEKIIEEKGVSDEIIRAGVKSLLNQGTSLSGVDVSQCASTEVKKVQWS